MSPHTHSRTGRSRRAPFAIGLAVALAAAAATAPAAHATPTPAPATGTALYGSADPTYDGVYRQSLAILGLHAAGITPAPSAVQWLLDQRCSNGIFTGFNPHPGDPSAPCPAYDGNAYTGGFDSNATAMATQALLAVGKTAEATTAANALKAAQDSTDFGWEYTIGNHYGSDPNSSALVLTALDAAGVTPLHDPAPYFASLQFGQGQATADTTKQGALAAYSGGNPNTYATMQAVPGVGGFNLVDAPTPATWADNPTTITVAPSPTAANIADWGSTWLASKVDADAVAGSELAWTVLSFATTATAKLQANTAYARLRANALDLASDDYAASGLGQAAIAAKVLGKADDLALYGKLIQNTLTTAPTAAYSLSTSSVYSTQSVTLKRIALTGDAASVTQTVNWGDGTTTTALGSAKSSFTHTYVNTTGTPRTHAVSVTLVDGIGDRRAIAVGSVKVTRDTTIPKVSLTNPNPTNAVSSWRYLHGTSTDVGLGTKNVTVHLVEKRGNAWYAYNDSKWSKKASHIAANSAAKRIVVPVRRGAWELKITNLTTGSLEVLFKATDQAGNTSGVWKTPATLTK